MKPTGRIVSYVFGLLAWTVSVPGLALEVYQWTDENGVIHFSQWAPGDEVENVETVSVKGGGKMDNGLGISEADDPEGYKAHREEMAALWAKIEARKEAERRAPSTEIVYLPSEPYYEYPFFGPGFGLRPPFRPDRPPHRPKPPPEPEQALPSVPFKRP